MKLGEIAALVPGLAEAVAQATREKAVLDGLPPNVKKPVLDSYQDGRGADETHLGEWPGIGGPAVG